MNKGVAECVIDYLAGQVEEGSKSPKRVLKLLGRTVSRAALSALSALLFAIPALDMVVENRDDGSTGDLGVDVYPRRTSTPAPDPHAPPATDPGQPPLPANARALGGVDLDRYCGRWGLRAYRR